MAFEIDFKQELTDENGEALRYPSAKAHRFSNGSVIDPASGEGRVITLGSVCVDALKIETGFRMQGDDEVRDKVRRFDLIDFIAQAVKSGAPASGLSEEERVFIAGCVARTHPAITAGRAIRMLCPDSKGR